MVFLVSFGLMALSPKLGSLYFVWILGFIAGPGTPKAGGGGAMPGIPGGGGGAPGKPGGGGGGGGMPGIPGSGGGGGGGGPEAPPRGVKNYLNS